MDNDVVSRKLLRAVALAASLTVAASCTEPEIRQPAAIAVASGDEQEGEVGEPLPLDITVRVTDDEGRTVPRVPITFEILTAATPDFTRGSVAPASAETDRSGVARTQWTLGTAAGEQTLRAWIGSAANSTSLHVDLRATAQPGAAASLVRVSEPVVAITVGDSVRVAVAAKDRYGNSTPVTPGLTGKVGNAAVASVRRTELTPDGAAVVALATGKGTTVLEARDAAGHAVSFELRTYVGPGRDIAYASGGNIYVLRADGNAITGLGPGGDPAWSPDGRRIAFTGNAGASGPSSLYGTAIYVVNADGSGRRALTDPATLLASQPAWSPDGRKIAFVAPSNEAGVSTSGALFVMNADGSAPAQLLRAQGPCLMTCVGYPAWSPDGTRIAYSVHWTHSSGARRADVFAVNADGSGNRALGSGHEVAWSADGSRVVFESFAACDLGPSAPCADLHLVNVDGTGRTRVTTASSIKSSDIAPTWSPDDRIAFVRVPGHSSLRWLGPSELWVVNADGTEARRVASVTGGIARVSWRPGP